MLCLLPSSAGTASPQHSPKASRLSEGHQQGSSPKPTQGMSHTVRCHAQQYKLGKSEEKRGVETRHFCYGSICLPTQPLCVLRPCFWWLNITSWWEVQSNSFLLFLIPSLCFFFFFLLLLPFPLIKLLNLQSFAFFPIVFPLPVHLWRRRERTAWWSWATHWQLNSHSPFVGSKSLYI